MKVGDETLGSVVTFRKTVLFSIQYKCFKTVIKIKASSWLNRTLCYHMQSIHCY